MAVKLESTIRRYIGLATDGLPTPGEYSEAAGRVLTVEDVPPGSTFKDNHGRISTWDGSGWRLLDMTADNADIVQALAELRLEVAQLRIGLIETGRCSEVSALDAQAAIAAGSL